MRDGFELYISANIKCKMPSLLKQFLVCFADLASVVLIVICNKALMIPPVNFTFPVTLTAAHFVATACVTLVTSRVLPFQQDALSDAKPQRSPPFLEAALFVAVSTAAVVSVNASLLLNSVAFYQIMKLLTLPFVAAFQATTGAEKYSCQHLCAFAGILCGVGLTINGEFETNTAGFVVAVASAALAGLSQILCGRMQKRYGMSPSALLSIVSPFKACVLIVIGPLLDRVVSNDTWFFRYAWTASAVQLSICSCILAVMVNLAQYTAISLLGPSMYNGSLVFRGYVSLQQIAGTTVAVLAVWCLAWLKAKMRDAT